ncbi:hypothetical protein JKG47_08725 [Acidithiobacillus sp. MC6.1]|nr:hypothetical protein [Acidithiobacillus sp. MC6.1]
MDKESLEKIIPAGLSGQIREKALDAAVLASSLLHMSKEDIVDRVAEIAKEHGIEPASGRTWMLFYKDVNERVKTSKEIIGIAQEPGAQVLGVGREADRYRARKADERQAAHHVPIPSMTMPGVTGVAYLAETDLTKARAAAAARGDDLATDALNKKDALAKAVRKQFSAEVGSHANSQSGRNGVYSRDQLADGWTGRGGEDRGAGTGTIGDDVGDSSAFGKVHLHVDNDLEQAVDSLETRVIKTKANSRRHVAAHHADVHRKVEIHHRKAAMHFKDRDYIGFRTLMENAHLLDDEHKGRGKAGGSPERERMSTHLKTNLLYASEATARGIQPDIMEAIRKLHDMPDPGPLGLDARARDRMDKSMSRLTEDFRVQKEANHNQREARKEKKAAKSRGAGKKRGPGRDDSGPER